MKFARGSSAGRRLPGLLLLLIPLAGWCQDPPRLTLREAEEIALKNNPRVSVALLTALAANQVTTQVHSATSPFAFGSLTGGAALENSRIAAGALNNPVIYNRLASGVTVSQLLTDFGRTSNLIESASLRAKAQEEQVKATRAEVLVQVDRAYFGALRAQAVTRVSEQTVAARQLVLDQITALMQSKLRSELDVSFSAVRLSEAKLLLIGARNEIRASFSELTFALGLPAPRDYVLVEEPLPQELAPETADLLKDAFASRPDLSRLRLEVESANRFAVAEKDLRLPTISAIGTVGVLPAHQSPQLPDRYGAAGVNVNIPIFNGRLFSARRAEAELRARALERQTKELEQRIQRDVEIAWLNASTARQRMDVTAELLAQSDKALDLAQARYDLGLSSIVELSQAQLNKTVAEIAAASAKYDYQIQRSVLNYQSGLLR